MPRELALEMVLWWFMVWMMTMARTKDFSWRLFEKIKVVATNHQPTLSFRKKNNILALHSNWQGKMRLLLAISPASPMKIFIINFHGNENKKNIPTNQNIIFNQILINSTFKNIVGWRLA